jgi:hypothetical protein
MNHNDDSGPVFPTQWTNEGNLNETSPNGYVVPPGASVLVPGITKRELFAAILMHGELVTCGVPGEAADALVEASCVAGTDVIDHMAGNAVEAADALLCALAEPKPEPAPPHLQYDAWTTPALEHLAIKRLAEWHGFEDLPPLIREFVGLAKSAIANSEDGIPF